MAITVRDAVSSDIANILPMIARICALHQSWDSARFGFLPQVERLYSGWVEELITDPQDLCLVAETTLSSNPDASLLVGFLLATTEAEVPVYHLKQYGYIHDLWVEPDYRQQGIARQFVKQTIQHFQTIGVQQIRLNTTVANDAAQKLYQSCGFRPSTLEMLMELPRNTR